jgi:ABC-type multidrug transport system ATPase subunit
MMSTHIMEIAQGLCDRVAIVDHGRIAAIGTVDELRALRGDATLEDVFLGITGGAPGGTAAGDRLRSIVARSR